MINSKFTCSILKTSLISTLKHFWLGKMIVSRGASLTKKWNCHDLPIVGWLVTRTSCLITIIRCSAADLLSCILLCSQKWSTFMGLNRMAWAPGTKMFEMNECFIFQLCTYRYFHPVCCFLRFAMLFCLSFCLHFVAGGDLSGNFQRLLTGFSQSETAERELVVRRRWKYRALRCMQTRWYEIQRGRGRGEDRT